MPDCLVTGASGFLGMEICRSLKKTGHVFTLGRSPQNDYSIDLSTTRPVFREAFDGVVHNAGLAHTVPKNESEGKRFFQVNVDGTKNLLKGLDAMTVLPNTIVFISSIAVYGATAGEMLKEDHALEATDPYGLSKIQAEQILSHWAKNRNVKLVILRLPLLAGPNPPGNLGAMIRNMKRGTYLSIGGGVARKSMVMTSDVAELIPRILDKEGTFHLTDGYHPSFWEIETCISKQLKKKNPVSIPEWVASTLGFGGDVLSKLGLPSPITSSKVRKITSTLTFDDSRARQVLGWKPRRVLDGLTV